MKKKIKSIVALTLIVVMMVAVYHVPVMAAEQVSDVVAEHVSDNSATEAENVTNARALTGEFHYTGRLTNGRNLGTVTVSAASRTVKWTVGRTGSNGLVNLELTNIDTGEQRHLSTVANNTLDSLTWVGGGLPAGNWRVSVIYVSSAWLYDVDLYFYS